MYSSIGVVILHYKSWQNTIACISSFFTIDSQKLKINVVVVDNFSNDGSDEIIRDFIHKNNIDIDLISTKSNLGFAGGNNFGADFLYKQYGSDIIICTNNDIVIEDKDFYHKVIAEYNESGFDILGPDVYSITECIHQNPMHATFWNRTKVKKKMLNLRLKYVMLLIIKRLHIQKYFDIGDGKRANLDYINRKTGVQLNGSIVIFSSSYYHKMGYCFYPGTFFYLEEDILFEIIKRYNLISVYNPELKALHNHSAATRNEITENLDRKIFRIKNVLQSLRVFEDLLKGDK